MRLPAAADDPATSLLPNDRQQGAVWSFSPKDNWAAQPILTSVARVSDVQPADFDADGDVDLVVAEFGWRRTGQIVLVWTEERGAAVSWFRNQTKTSESN